MSAARITVDTNLLKNILWIKCRIDVEVRHGNSDTLSNRKYSPKYAKARQAVSYVKLFLDLILKTTSTRHGLQSNTSSIYSKRMQPSAQLSSQTPETKSENADDSPDSHHVIIHVYSSSKAFFLNFVLLSTSCNKRIPLLAHGSLLRFGYYYTCGVVIRSEKDGVVRLSVSLNVCAALCGAIQSAEKSVTHQFVIGAKHYHSAERMCSTRTNDKFQWY